MRGSPPAGHDQAAPAARAEGGVAAGKKREQPGLCLADDVVQRRENVFCRAELLLAGFIKPIMVYVSKNYFACT